MSDATAPGEAKPTPDEGLTRLLERAEAGDRAVLPALRRLLDCSPDLWRFCGDVARNAEVAGADLVAGSTLLLREALPRRLAALKAELAGPSSPPLERLLADRVAANWLQVGHADAAFAQARGKGLTPAQLDHLQRRQERAQRGYLAAI